MVRSTPTYSGGSFTWPVVGGGNYISQYFHYGHYGIDIAADYGTQRPVAASRRTVIFAGWKSNGGGYQVWIAHGSGPVHHVQPHVGGVGRARAARRAGPAGRPGRLVGLGDRSAPPLRGLEGPDLERRLAVNPLQYL